MTQTQHDLNFEIAHNLEQVQHINPELYGNWYSKLYFGNDGNVDLELWNQDTLNQIKQIINR